MNLRVFLLFRPTLSGYNTEALIFYLCDFWSYINIVTEINYEKALVGFIITTKQWYSISAIKNIIAI